MVELNEGTEIQLEGAGYELVAQTSWLQIKDQPSANMAGSMIQRMKEHIAEWKRYWAPLKQQAKKAHSMVCEREKMGLDRVEPAMLALAKRLGEWLTAEKARVEAERAAIEKKEWEERRAREEAESKIAKAVNFEEAQPFVEAIEAQPAPVTKPLDPVTQGVFFRDNWKFRVVDFDRIPRTYLKPDDTMIGECVRKMKDKTDIPGIEVYNEPTPVAKRSDT